MRLSPLVLALFPVILLASPAAAVAPDVDDAVFNGGFEIAAHQVRPYTCLLFGNGYTNVFDPGNPFGLPWLLSVSPCHQGAVKAAGWSSGQTVDVQDFNGDGDRETRFLAGTSDPNFGIQNLWQAYPNPHQAYVANFTALTLQVESGTIPAGAYIQLALTASPLAEAHPFVGLYVDCLLTFPPGTIVPDATGRVSLDPTTGVLQSVYSACGGSAAAFSATTDAGERRDILDGLRIVQHTYVGWHMGAAHVTIDDIAMEGSRTAAEALLS